MKVEAAANIFYDISDNNFTISDGSVQSTVGIKQVSQVNPMDLQVWPNPFSNKLSFSVGNLNSKNTTAINVIDVLGKTVLQLNYANKSELRESIDLSGLTSGVYFIKVNNDNKQSVHRIVKD